MPQFIIHALFSTTSLSSLLFAFSLSRNHFTISFLSFTVFVLFTFYSLHVRGEAGPGLHTLPSPPAGSPRSRSPRTPFFFPIFTFTAGGNEYAPLRVTDNRTGRACTLDVTATAFSYALRARC